MKIKDKRITCKTFEHYGGFVVRPLTFQPRPPPRFGDPLQCFGDPLQSDQRLQNAPHPLQILPELGARSPGT